MEDEELVFEASSEYEDNKKRDARSMTKKNVLCFFITTPFPVFKERYFLGKLHVFCQFWNSWIQGFLIPKFPNS